MTFQIEGAAATSKARGDRAEQLALDHLQRHDLDNGVYGRELAERYRQQLRGEELTFWDGAYFADEAHASLAKQQELEATDHLSFDAFLESYLSH